MTDYELYNLAELICWDNEGGEGGDAGAGDAGAGDAGAGGTATKTPETKEKTFTQEEVNKFVAERNKAVNAQLKVAEENYEAQLKQTGLTKEQRDKVSADLDAVRNEMMTKEQRAEAEKKKIEANYKSELEAAGKEANKYKELYETSTINREITDASIKQDAFNPNHFIAHLAPKSKMVDEVDAEGQTTGKLVPRVEWSSVDEEGKVHTSLLTPEEAVTKMKENVVEFGNLFKPNVAAGIGQGTAPGQASAGGQIDHSKISDADYMKMSSTPEGRAALGLPPLRN
jgi:hypothetical protein